MTQPSTTATAPAAPAFVPGDRVQAYAERRRYTGTVVELAGPIWVTVKIDGDRDTTSILADTLTALCSECSQLGTASRPLRRTVHTLMHGDCGC